MLKQSIITCHASVCHDTDTQSECKSHHDLQPAVNESWERAHHKNILTLKVKNKTSLDRSECDYIT